MRAIKYPACKYQETQAGHSRARWQGLAELCLQRLPSTNPCQSQEVTKVEGKESLNRALQIACETPVVHTNWDETNSAMGESAGRGNTPIPLELWQRREESRGKQKRAQRSLHQQLL
jgi:hypothetical protein